MSKNRVLGKGLSALIQGADLKGMTTAPDEDASIHLVPLENIGFNPDQPRKLFDSNKLEELARSIEQVGILQPVLVRQLQGGETATRHPDSEAPPSLVSYCVVAGERRVRAARLAGLNEVPALVCTYEETEALKVALLENIQREDLGPVEEASAYRNLLESYGATQDELAEMLGKKRSSVTNMLRILTLEKEILALLRDGRITRGHAKALLGLPAGPARVQLAKMCHSRDLSVRECERRVQAGGSNPRKKKSRRKTAAGPVDPALRALMENAERVFGSPVSIARDAGNGKGSISLRFYSDSDLVRVLKIMGVDTDIS
ncbi:MAG: ParB/RepB/Spo0J family partition protein [Candidatus Krumholzibacteria bacterium]|nr:ParB/RepB/Spo0J family partition protein [Candidatus Krumholzibacteria bacterium]